MNLRIQLLGALRITRDGNTIDLPGQRPMALLAYLIVTGKPQRREHLIDLLFDYPDDPQAALRWTLSKIRKAIGSEYILADRSEVSFNFQSAYWLDVDAVKAGEIELYQGEFMQGLYVRDALRFEDWLLGERQRLRDIYQAGLEQQMETHRKLHEFAAAAAAARQLLKLDGLREDWHAALIQAYALQGKSAAALEQYELCRRLLMKEWSREPSAETQALAEAIRSGRFGAEAALVDRFSVEAAGRHNSRGGEVTGVVIRSPQEALTGPQSRNRQGLSRQLLAIPATILLIAALVFVLSRGRNLNLSLAQGETSASLENGAVELKLNSSQPASRTVIILGQYLEDKARLFQQSLAPFEERSGINVIFATGEQNYDLDIETRLETGDIPDIISLPQPGWLAKLAKQEKILDIGAFLDDDYLRQQYPEPFIDLVKVDGRLLGVLHTVNLKSLVWYPKKAFEARGYETPETWEELIALSDRIVTDGGTPWCIGIESQDASGWPATDWIEDILLRTAPPETYDAWVRHELPFNSSEIRQAFEIMGQIWLNDEYIFGGTANIIAENFADSPDHLFEDPPGCYLHKQASFVPFFFPPGVVYGEDYDFFELPPIDAQFGQAVLGGGDIFVMVKDRPEVREVMRYLTTAKSTKALIENGGYLNPHKNTPIDWFPTPSDLRFAQIVLGADAYRFDGSDLMPEEVGLGSFFQGVTDWLNGANLETVLQEIDASWPAQ